MKRINPKRFLLSAVLLLLNAGICSADMQSSPELGKLFADAGVNGTFVLYDVTANQFVVHDQQRVETRFIPASTFKIPNSLIGLSTGAVESVDEVLPL